ncbi:palmitoyltransferase ZDHHC9/14/18 [Entomortierella parvispora]|uniref:Palmitoyltransferase n=1 Tax=Entomortierella parvispora TaxID=205924 RepID=A0A9P3H8R4_9FUNG|nr:palmitoyltransferase ZDHHC9/14/18 [Entomortierella parvispora]
MDNADWPHSRGQGQELHQSHMDKEKDPDMMDLDRPQRLSPPSSPGASTVAPPSEVHSTIPDCTDHADDPTGPVHRPPHHIVGGLDCDTTNLQLQKQQLPKQQQQQEQQQSSPKISPRSGAGLPVDYRSRAVLAPAHPADIHDSGPGQFTSFQSFFAQPSSQEDSGMSFEQMLMSEPPVPPPSTISSATAAHFSPVREPESMSPRSNKAVRSLSAGIPVGMGDDIPMTGPNHSQDMHHPGADSGVTGHATDHEDGYLHQQKPIRNYKIFPGRNIFFCGGRIMTSRDFPAFLLAIMLLCVPTGLFHGFSSPYLWHRLSPAAPILQAYLFIVTFSSMLKTSWTDPGVIPRGIDSDPPLDPPLELENGSASFYPPRGLPRVKEIQVGIYTLRLKYCDTCKIYRPPRCSHCRQCDNCVEDEDHHCVWLNNCIGRRNYRYFLIFVTTASIYALYTSALCLTHLLLLYHDKKDALGPGGVASFQKDALGKAPVAGLVMVFSFIMGLAVGALATYHFWLATKNRTTHEQLSASMMRPVRVDNPFDQGSIFANCAAVLCRPPTRSYIRRRDYTTSVVPA